MRNFLYQTMFFVFFIALCLRIDGSDPERDGTVWRKYLDSLPPVHQMVREELQVMWDWCLAERKRKRDLAGQGLNATQRLRKRLLERKSHLKMFSGQVQGADGDNEVATATINDGAGLSIHGDSGASAHEKGTTTQEARDQLAALAGADDNEVPPELRFSDSTDTISQLGYLYQLNEELAALAAQMESELAARKEE